VHNHKLPSGGVSELAEVEVYKLVQAGCRACLNQLMSRHEGLVMFVVRRQTLGQLSFGAALHAGRIGLWRAILGYDPQRGYAFSTYAYPAIARHIWQAVKRTECGEVSPRLWSSDPTTDGTDPVAIWEACQVCVALCELVGRLPERLQIIIIARYGLGDKSPATYREIGAVLGLTGERVRQLHTEALVWLRHPGHSQCLRSLLGLHTLAEYEMAEVLVQRWLRWRGGHRGH
jgi:RNA polymerase sigma factor (sigma-70 family)